jgi:hypothetical protein
MNILEEYIHESIAAAVMHAKRRHREEDSSQKGLKSSQYRKSSAPKFIGRSDKDRKGASDAIRLVGPDKAREIYNNLKNMTPEEIKNSFGHRIYSYDTFMFGPNAKRDALPLAQAAMASAIYHLGDNAQETIETILSQ